MIKTERYGKGDFLKTSADDYSDALRKSVTVKNGDISLTVAEYGATILSLKFKEKEMTLGYDDTEEYKKQDGYLGATVGRFANRIANGEFYLNGKRYGLYKNDGNNTLHGGKVGFNAVLWDLSVKGNAIIAEYESKDMEEGFPGNLKVKVEFSVNADGIEISYMATSDKDTVINLTNHTYFNLAGRAENIENHYLTLFADGFTPIDSGLIPTGEIKGVKGTPFDFMEPKLIGKDINAEDTQLIRAGGYDHNFVINGAGYRKFAEVYCKASGIKMQCFTDMPGVQFYSGNFLTERKGRNGETIKKRHGFCLETQFFPNSVNEPAFPSCVLRAGEVFTAKTGYKFV